jgi:hypothetical protein
VGAAVQAILINTKTISASANIYTSQAGDCSVRDDTTALSRYCRKLCRHVEVWTQLAFFTTETSPYQSFVNWSTSHVLLQTTDAKNPSYKLATGHMETVCGVRAGSDHIQHQHLRVARSAKGAQQMSVACASPCILVIPARTSHPRAIGESLSLCSHVSNLCNLCRIAMARTLSRCLCSSRDAVVSCFFSAPKSSDEHENERTAHSLSPPAVLIRSAVSCWT